MDYPIRTIEQLRPVLIDLRKSASKSQADVAALLGITQQSYARIEANPAATSGARLLTILRLLGAGMVITSPAHASQTRADTPETW